MNINNNNEEIEFSNVPITEVNVYYGKKNTYKKTYNSNNIRTRIGTLNIVNTISESESDITIKPIKYTSLLESILHLQVVDQYLETVNDRYSR